MRCFAGEQPYFPAIQPSLPVEEIRLALVAGASAKQVVRQFSLSRSTLYRLFPGGLPGRPRGRIR
ncbi:helix-turn-helix domain-containing protein [Xanthomonas arboricola]|uniref:helix-turn-helix domain-containing protein n=1 Tax=Xanthomonas arboricola TaxID=56448 RepID=UPI001D04A7CD